MSVTTNNFNGKIKTSQFDLEIKAMTKTLVQYIYMYQNSKAVSRKDESKPMLLSLSACARDLICGTHLVLQIIISAGYQNESQLWSILNGYRSSC